MSSYNYPQYCIHNQPIYYQGCSGCKAIKEAESQKRYEAYWNKTRIPFWEYFKSAMGGDPRDPDVVYKIPEEFAPLRRSKSAEELRKEYHKLARKMHPDKGGSTSLFQRLQNIYERLFSSF
tara:strand:- start:4075 stop:4437 length:363 start_codon:yes stop_codon:yes gene_type:complete